MSLLKDEIESSKIFFLGKRSDFQKILKNCDVFVLPSLHETFGNVYMEASLAGIPSIGLNVGGIPEIIEHRKSGILLETLNIDELTNAMEELTKNQNMRIQMGHNALKIAKKRFDNSELVLKYLKLYEKLMLV